MMTAFQLFSSADLAIMSPMSATCVLAEPSTIRILPFPGVDKISLTLELSSGQKTVSICPE